MGRTDCTEPQCLYKGDLYLYVTTTCMWHLLLRFKSLSYARHSLLIFKINISCYAGVIYCFWADIGCVVCELVSEFWDI